MAEQLAIEVDVKNVMHTHGQTEHGQVPLFVLDSKSYRLLDGLLELQHSHIANAIKPYVCSSY